MKHNTPWELPAWGMTPYHQGQSRVAQKSYYATENNKMVLVVQTNNLSTIAFLVIKRYLSILNLIYTIDIYKEKKNT